MESSANGTSTTLRTAVVMDDQADVCATIAAQLASLDMSASSVSSREELVDTLACGHPDLLVLDLSLGDTDAVDVFGQLASLGFAGATLLISGHHDSILEHAERIGRRQGILMVGSLRKPIRLRDLKDILNRRISAKTRPAHMKKQEAESGLLDLAMDQNWLDFHYQPKVNIHTGGIRGAECLARLRHPERGLLSPSAFIGRASGDELERLFWCSVNHAFQSAQTVLADSHLELSINLSGRTIAKPGLVERLCNLRKCNCVHLPITLELTETDLVKDQAAAEAFATRAALHGFRLSIDDFGTGYATFDRLRTLPFHELKLDRSIVSGCGRNAAQQNICRAAVALAHDFQADAVAEGVETAEDLEMVRDLGFDLAQGHLFSRAMPVSELTTFAGHRSVGRARLG